MKIIFKHYLPFFLVTFVISLSNPVFADDKAEMQKLGDLLALSIRVNDFTEIDKKISLDVFIQRVAEGLSVPDAEQAGFKKGMSNSLSAGMLKKMFAGLEAQEKTADFIGLFTIENSTRPVVRISYTAGGVNFIELELIKNKQGFQIVDMYVAANGQYLSDTVKQAGMMMLNQPGGWIASLIDDQTSRENITKVIQEALAFKNQGKIKEMYQALQQLPESVKRKEVVQLMLVTSASAGMSEDVYKQELGNLARYHGDNPRYAFMLVDYYFYENKYNQALKALSSLLKRYNKDASLLTLRATILMSAKNYAKAYSNLEEALIKEPGYEDAYWTVTTVSLNEGNYQKTLDWLGKLEARFGYEFAEENFAEQEIYQDFVASAEFKTWIASKSH